MELPVIIICPAQNILWKELFQLHSIIKLILLFICCTNNNLKNKGSNLKLKNQKILYQTNKILHVHCSTSSKLNLVIWNIYTLNILFHVQYFKTEKKSLRFRHICINDNNTIICLCRNFHTFYNDFFVVWWRMIQNNSIYYNNSSRIRNKCIIIQSNFITYPWGIVAINLIIQFYINLLNKGC